MTNFIKKHSKKILKAAAAGLLTVVALSGLLLGLGSKDKIFKADVAVILGNEVYLNGQPAPRLAARLDKGLELYRAGWCRKLLVSGGVGLSQVDEAEAMAAYLRNKGVPSTDIIIDSTGLNTWGTALFTAAYMKEHELSKAIVVTQHFHVPRSVLALKSAGCQNVGQAAADYWESGDVYSTLRELLALPFYWWKYF